MRPQRRSGRRRRVAARPRTRRTSAVLPAERPLEPAVPRVAELIETDDEGIRDAAAAVLGCADRAGSVKLDDESRWRSVGVLVDDGASDRGHLPDRPDRDTVT